MRERREKSALVVDLEWVHNTYFFKMLINWKYCMYHFVWVPILIAGLIFQITIKFHSIPSKFQHSAQIRKVSGFS